MTARVAELSRFIELLSARFKRAEMDSAGRLDVAERDVALLRTLVSEGPMITKELGARFEVPVSTMTGLVDRMEEKGFVRRVVHRRDRRSIELEATAAGAAALRESTHVIEAMARGMLEAIPEKDQKALLAILRRIRIGIEGAPAAQPRPAASSSRTPRAPEGGARRSAIGAAEPRSAASSARGHVRTASGPEGRASRSAIGAAEPRSAASSARGHK